MRRTTKKKIEWVEIFDFTQTESGHKMTDKQIKEAFRIIKHLASVIYEDAKLKDNKIYYKDRYIKFSDRIIEYEATYINGIVDAVWVSEIV